MTLYYFTKNSNLKNTYFSKEPKKKKNQILNTNRTLYHNIYLPFFQVRSAGDRDEGSQ